MYASLLAFFGTGVVDDATVDGANVVVVVVVVDVVVVVFVLFAVAEDVSFCISSPKTDTVKSCQQKMTATSVPISFL